MLWPTNGDKGARAMKLEPNNIYLGDCLEVMREIPDKSIDLTATSPPYDNLRTYNDSLEWSFEIFQKIAKELYRVTKDGGVIVWVVGDATINGSETGTSFKQALYFKEIGFNLYDTMIWEKRVPPVNSRRYEPSFEYMFILSKGNINTFNGIREDRKYLDKRTKKQFFREKDDKRESNYENKIGPVLKTNIWKIDNRDISEHPAIFPLKLIKNHIISWTNENDLILDPFLGSGTTAIACHDLKRNFICIEKEPEYHKIACERYEKHKAQLTLF